MPRACRRFALVGASSLVLALVPLPVGAEDGPPCLFPPCPTPVATATPRPSGTPVPSSTATPSPTPRRSGLPIFPGQPTPPGTATASPSPSPTTAPASPSYDNLPALLQQGFDLEVPNIKRTPPHNTAKLVEELEPLTDYGFPLQEVLVEGMGRFPVAGLAYYSDDWLMPRFSPVPHLHHGLDIFADRNTPIRAVDDGVVTELNDDPGGGGIGVFMRGLDGTVYYFWHMDHRAEGIHVGQRVHVGTVLGYVGNTGNAAGGPTHLHFEVHPKGGAPVPPKPYVDRWLADAEGAAPKWVSERIAAWDEAHGIKVEASAAEARAPRPARGELDASMLLTLLDPVGGSVGLLPRLELERARRPTVSSELVRELIRMRLGGYLFAPPQASRLSD